MDKNIPEMMTALITEIVISISQNPMPNVMPKKCVGNQHHAVTWARRRTTQAPWSSSARQRGLATPQHGTSAADASELRRPPHRRPRSHSHHAPFPMEGAINRHRSHGGDREEVQSRSGEARNHGHGAMHRHCRGSRPRSRGGGGRGGGGGCGGRPVQGAVQTE